MEEINAILSGPGGYAGMLLSMWLLLRKDLQMLHEKAAVTAASARRAHERIDSILMDKPQ